MRFVTCSVLVLGMFSGVTFGEGADKKAKKLPALVEGSHGVVVGTTGPMSVKAGLEILKRGGTAADAAMATSLAQVVECAGSYVSHAGILGMVYCEAATGKILFLNAAYNTPREEKDPSTWALAGVSSSSRPRLP